MVHHMPDPSENHLPPLMADAVAAGFPSPADGHLERTLNLHDLLVRHPAATFFVRVAGDSMREAGILSGDILVVDRSLSPRDRQVVVAVVDGEFMVKQLRWRANRWWLVAAAPEYPPVPVGGEPGEGGDTAIWGVVAALVREKVG